MTEGKSTIMLNLPPLADRQAGKSTFWHSVLGSNDSLDEIDGASDRVMAILGAAIVERHLTTLLARSFVADPVEQERAFRPDGALGAFMAKARMGYLLGLFSDDVRNDLALIAKTRNIFAHSSEPLSFAVVGIAKHCRVLRTPDKWTRKTHSGGHPGDGMLTAGHDPSGRLHWVNLDFFERDERILDNRWRFEAAVQLISYGLAHGSPIRPGPAIP